MISVLSADLSAHGMDVKLSTLKTPFAWDHGYRNVKDKTMKRIKITIIATIPNDEATEIKNLIYTGEVQKEYKKAGCKRVVVSYEDVTNNYY